MGITISLVNDTPHTVVGRLDEEHSTIAEFDIPVGDKWSRTDDGIRCGGAYMLRCYKNGKGTKYSFHVMAPEHRGTKEVKLSEVFDAANKSGMYKVTHKLSMEGQIHSAIRILSAFTGQNALDLRIPSTVIYGAKGLAFMTQSKVGFMFSVTGGLGVVLVRNHDGGWTGPSAFGCGGLGAGFQMGASLTRSLLILNNDAAVKAFSGGGQIKLGASLSVAAGPMGREAGVEARAGKGKVAACFSYALTQGLFGGVSLDGAILTARNSENKKFYKREVKVSDILNGKEPPPDNGRLNELYRELKQLEASTGMRKDGKLHSSQIANLAVNQQDEVKQLLKYEIQPTQQHIGHICAPLSFQERLDFGHATNMQEAILDQATGFKRVKEGDNKEKSHDMKRSGPKMNDSKALTQLKILVSTHSSSTDMMKVISKALIRQLPFKDSFLGEYAARWCMEGGLNFMHSTVTEKDRVHLMLARTMIAQDDKITEANKSKKEYEKFARLFEIRIYVLFNLLLKHGYIVRTDPQAEDHGFDPGKRYSFTPKCGKGTSVSAAKKRFSIFGFGGKKS